MMGAYKVGRASSDLKFLLKMKNKKNQHIKEGMESEERKIEEEIQAVEKEISNLKEKIEIEQDWETYEKLLKLSNQMK